MSSDGPCLTTATPMDELEDGHLRCLKAVLCRVSMAMRKPAAVETREERQTRVQECVGIADRHKQWIKVLARSWQGGSCTAQCLEALYSFTSIDHDRSLVRCVRTLARRVCHMRRSSGT
jgi:hypothetical protein